VINKPVPDISPVETYEENAMARMLETQLRELRETMEMYKLAADRSGRASQSCCLSLALESLERCSRLVQLALTPSPPEEIVREQAKSLESEFHCSGARTD
jgi:hypothetical protein